MVTPAAAARALGVSIRTLHRWEQSGMISVVRLPSGVRRYEQREVDRIKAGSARSVPPDVEAVR